jgi:hypothetical protein
MQAAMDKTASFAHLGLLRGLRLTEALSSSFRDYLDDVSTALS